MLDNTTPVKTTKRDRGDADAARVNHLCNAIIQGGEQAYLITSMYAEAVMNGFTAIRKKLEKPAT